MPESIRNPITGEEVTFLHTAATSGGDRTVLEIRLPPRASGPPVHYHEAVTETFEVLEGELTVQLGRETIRLGEGQRAVVEPGCLHTFRSERDQPVRFRGTIEPSSADAEKCFRIAFGLARDGLVSKAGVPKRLSDLVILVTMSQSSLPGLGRVLLPLCRLWARTGRVQAIQRELITRYCSLPAGMRTGDDTASASSPT